MKYSVALLLDDVGDVFAVAALIEQNIHCQVRDKISNGGNTFKGDVGETGIRIILKGIRIGQIELLSILTDSSIRKIEKVAPATIEILAC